MIRHFSVSLCTVPFRFVLFRSVLFCSIIPVGGAASRDSTRQYGAEHAESFQQRISLLSEFPFQVGQIVLVLVGPILGYETPAFAFACVSFFRGGTGSFVVFVVVAHHVLVDQVLEPASEHANLSDLERGKAVVGGFGPSQEIYEVDIGHEVEIVEGSGVVGRQEQPRVPIEIDSVGQDAHFFPELVPT